MAIHTFSTKGKRPQDTEVVEQVKQYCEEHKLVFSAIVVELLTEWRDENVRRPEEV